MSYISQHHHTLRNMPFSELQGLTVLLVEPEAEARSFYSQQLTNIDMRVVPIDSIAVMHNEAANISPDVVIVNPTTDINSSIRALKSFKQQFPTLPVITIAMTIPDEVLDAIMESGVSLHINRGLTRPRDLLLALEQVIIYK